MIHRLACWSAPLRAAAFTAAALAIQSASAVEPANKSEISERFNVADATPINQNAYLDDSNGVAANDGVVEVVRDRYQNGNVRIERCVILDADKNYVNHGSWKMFATGGEVIAEGQYDMGKRLGMWVRYVGRNDSPVLNENPYNKFKAPFISQANFTNGVMDGEWLIEDSDKRKVVQITFKNGERHGPSIAWLPNGKMFRQATYDEGVPVGDVLEINSKNGEFERAASYVDGRKVINKTTYYSGSRNKKSEAVYLAATTVKKSSDDFWSMQFAGYTSQGKDLRHGAWKEWYTNGKPLQEGFYQNDKKTGTFMFWHENGQVAVTGEYKDDVPQGLWVWYHENGLKSAIGKYEDGTYIGEWRWWNEDGRLTKRKTYTGAEGISSQPQESEEVFDLSRVPSDVGTTVK
jgi:antitoxin component YwqK of YwqJK toxin-antitoxin module